MHHLLRNDLTKIQHVQNTEGRKQQKIHKDSVEERKTPRREEEGRTKGDYKLIQTSDEHNTLQRPRTVGVESRGGKGRVKKIQANRACRGAARKQRKVGDGDEEEDGGEKRKRMQEENGRGLGLQKFK